MKADIIGIVNLIRSADFFGGEEHIELAKGKHQLTTARNFKRKLKRRIEWLSQKQ